jgi:hypothetical protein
MMVLSAGSKTRTAKIAAALGMHLWGFTGNVVWTDSVQGVFENNFGRCLSTAGFTRSRGGRGEIREWCSIDSYMQRSERYFLAARINSFDAFALL